MSDLARLAAACLLPSFDGPAAPDWIRRLLADGAGGVVLFASNVRDPAQLAELTATLRADGSDVLIGLDEEGGDVTRLEWETGSSYPGNAALGEVDDVALTEAVAASIGAELAAVGVNLDLAPVADVNVNPANPVIGVRSFGLDPEGVARHVAAFVRGLQAQGVAACAKHFPGHGSTAGDSHLELPTVQGDVEDGLPPFRAAIEAGVQSIMTAHVRVPGLDDAPATVSRAVVHGLLRERLGYDGLVIADALEMKGVADTVGVEEAAVRALAAGVDALCIGRDLGEEWTGRVHRTLVDAVAEGRLEEARLHEAAGRVHRAGAWAAAPAARTPVDRESGAAAARRALHVEGSPELAAPALVVELEPDANVAAGVARHSLGALLAERLPGTDAVRFRDVHARRDGRRLVIVVRDLHRHPWMREQTAALLATDPEGVVVEIGLSLGRPAEARHYVATSGGSRVSFEAAAARLVGAGG